LKQATGHQVPIPAAGAKIAARVSIIRSSGIVHPARKSTDRQCYKY